MKLHLPARLRSALLACLAVVTPLACTVATGAFVGVGAVAALSSSVAQAAEVQVAAGATVDYNSGDTYVLAGGTLNVEQNVSSAIKVANADSVIKLGDSAKLSPLYVSLQEGVTGFKLSGTGTYDLASATSMYGANVTDTGWTGVVSISKAESVGAFDFNTYGNANSTVKVSGVSGWLAFDRTWNPTVWLEDQTSGAPALLIADGSSNRNYGFNGMKGAGTLERGGNKFTGTINLNIRGDVSEWTGKYVNNYGTTNLSFNTNATALNLSEIVNNSGYALTVNINGATASTVNTKIHSTAGGDLNLAVGNASGATFNADVTATSLSGSGAITVAKGAALSVSGASTLSSTLNVQGTAKLMGGVTLNRTIENSGSLTIAGNFNVNSASLLQTTTGDSTFTNGNNGVMETGQIVYYVVKNASGASLNTSGAVFSFDGSEDVELLANGTVLRDKAAGDTTYWVNKGDVSLAGTNAASYRMNGGTLVLDKADAAQQGQALVGVVGDEGKVKITANTTLTGEMKTKATCDLIVSGATLKLGEAEAQAVNISSFSSVTLENNALIRIQAQSFSINNLTVAETGGRIDVKDTQSVPSGNPYSFAGVTTLHGTLTRTPDGGWGNGMLFERLAGKGSFVYVNNPNEQSYVAINSLQGFTGDLSFTQSNNNGSAYEVIIKSGAADVAMNSLTIGRSNKLTAADFANMSGSISVESGKTLALSGALTMQSNLDLAISGAAGLKLNGGLVVQGADNNINIMGSSALGLGTLQIQNGASLAVNGLVSSLAMNQAGSLIQNGMTIQDGGSLVYSADHNVIKITADKLAGKVNVDLNSLTTTQSQAIAAGTPFDLGIDSSVSKDLIGTISDNIRDIVLSNDGSTWKITGGVVSMYWEKDNGEWNDTAANWAFKDEATAGSTYIAGTDAIFSGDAAATVTVTQDVDVKNIEVKNGNYTLAMDGAYSGDLNVGNDLILGSSATLAITGSNGNSLNVAGNVKVAKGSSLSVSMESAKVTGALTGEGSVTVNSNLSLGNSSSIGQLVVSGTVSMDGSNKALTVGGTSSAKGLSKVSTLTVNKGGSMKVTNATTLGKLAGEGSLTASSLTLTSGASSIAQLNADSLTLKKEVTLTADKLGVSQVNKTLGVKAVEGATVMEIGKTLKDTVVTLTVDSVDDLKKLTNGSVVTIANVGSLGGTLSGVLVAPTTAPTGTDVVTKSDKEFSVTSNLRGFGYTMLVETSGTSAKVVMKTGRDNDGWIGEAGDSWTQGAQEGWETGYVPNPTDRAAGFFGDGTSVVNVDEAGVSTALIDVDIAQDKLDEKPSYTFVGGAVEATNAMIGQGELIIANDTTITENAEVYTRGAMTVADGGALSIGGDLQMSETVSLTVDAGASADIGGKLSSESTVTITNNGSLAIDVADIAGELTGAEDSVLNVREGGTIGSVQGGLLALGTEPASGIALAAGAPTLTLEKDSTLSGLSGLTAGSSLVSSAAITIDAAAEGAVNVTAKALTLNTIGGEFGVLSVESIMLNDTVAGLSNSVAGLSVQGINVGAPVAISLSLGVIEAIPTGDDALIIPDDYILISGITGHTIEDFAFADAQLQEIKRRGVTADVQVQGDNLVLSLGAIGDGGMIWDTTDGNQLTNNGYEVPTGAGLYKALDYVAQVKVTGDKLINLTAPGVGDAAAGNATIPAAGLLIRNLDGGGQLSVLGDGADKDAVTIISNREIKDAVALRAESVKVNLGLPAGTEGILAGDDESDTLALSAADLTDGAALQVNADTTVEGATTLDASSVQVAEGAVLTTSRLSGVEGSTVGGAIRISGVGGDYSGAYAATGAEISVGKGAYQTLQAGKNLSLLMNGGEGKLNMPGASTAMTKLGLGTAPGSAEKVGAELELNNVTVDDKAGTVTHHTLTLDGADSYIGDAELRFSLGAAESAKTLGTADAPVIIDGAVNVRNATIGISMVTAQENLRALQVAEDAPLKDAVLAQLVSAPSVSGTNEVTLTGNRAMKALLSKYYSNARLAADGTIRVDRVTDYYTAAVGSGLSEPGTIGLEMMDKVLLNLNPQADTKSYKDLAGVMNALDDAVVAGKTGEVDSIASAVTGASHAALGAAMVGDIERQLRAIRNRTTTMGVDQGTVNHDMPYFNAWINAEVDNRKLDQDGMLPGYDYTVTGGTLGFDVDLTPSFTCGVAFTSVRGDFSSESADKLDADVESFYISGFARKTYRRWTHTFVAAFGKSDISMDRMVSFSGGSYTAKADTEAANFGVMYEMGYVMALDVDGSSCLQPVFNISLAHSSMDGFKESGSDAALSVSDVDMTTLTIGAGARMQSVVGENLFNRSSIFEARALVKLNAGDREAGVDTKMVLVPSAGGSLSSAERGAVSIELGAGITVPVGAISGSIFVDGAAELGGGYTDLNATVGYRLNF